jgi:membrane dipeptidase
MGASRDIPAWGPGGGLGPLAVAGFNRWEDMPALTAELLRRGYEEADLRKIYRQNVRRVLREVIIGA